MELKVYIRHLQMFDIYGNAIYYAGANPATIQTLHGQVPQTSWIDVSNDVANLDKINFDFRLDANTNGTAEKDNFTSQNNTTKELIFEGEAYKFIKSWCVDHVAAPLNAIDVRIEHVGCGNYLGYGIKANQIAWCEDGLCEFSATLKQNDALIQCIQKTTISDNWQGWFDSEPRNGKKHPRFSYCNEQRPNGMLIAVWWMISFIAFLCVSFLMPLAIAINPILWILQQIENVLNSIPGVNVSWNIPDPIDVQDIKSAFMRMYIESAGCGREHPAPLIRDYIKNVCDKCGIEVDGITAPIFFNDKISIQTSTRDLNNVWNPYYNACYLHAPSGRGVRRIDSVSIFEGASYNTRDYYIPENAPLESLEDFLNMLNGLFNTEWRIKNGKLYQWRKDWFSSDSYLYNFANNAVDRAKIIDGICFEWNELKMPASFQGIYSTDAIDTCGNEARNAMNGGIYSFGNTDINPNFNGLLDKTTLAFGATKFRLDGHSEDYLYDAMQFLLSGQFISGIPLVSFYMKDVEEWLKQYANYALLMKDETCMLGKVLIWDGVSYENAKCLLGYVPVANYMTNPTDMIPSINPDYNAITYNNGIPNYEDWITRHPTQTKLQAGKLTLGGQYTGVYKAKTIVGSVIAEHPARLVNYPMYFEPGYLDTLWDWFHWIDDPRKNPSLQMNWSLKIELCCEDLKKLGVMDYAEDIKLLEKIKLPLTHHPDGILKTIEVNYDSTQNVGKSITLKGTA